MPGILWLLIGAAAAHNAQAKAPDAAGQWVQVTRPVASCTASRDDAAVARRLDVAMRQAGSPGAMPAGCQMLRVGQKLRLDERRSAADRKVAEKMWAPAITGKAKAELVPVYAPSRSVVGDYLSPTSPPRLTAG